MRRFGYRLIAAIVLLSVTTVSTACYGPFNLTKNVYHWNSNIKGSDPSNEKWTREFVFFGMLVVPVYMFSALLDTFIFNSMHFWTGESPIKASDLGNDGTRVTTLGETTIRWAPSADGATVTYERHGMVERRATIVAGEKGFQLIDDHGAILSAAEYGLDGGIQLLDADGRVVKRWSAEQLSVIAQGSRAVVEEGVASK